MNHFLTTTVIVVVTAICPAVSSALPPVPVPAQNPMTEEKRLLGKMLFWDEQLSSDNTVACGTCHKPAYGGADDRTALHPGYDKVIGTGDDVVGSPGIRRLDRRGVPTGDPAHSHARQATGRSTPSYFAALWSDTLFWDGRAGSEFRDPLTQEILIPVGGALESQAVGPLLNDVEMAKQARDWKDLTTKLERAVPLALARNLPADIRHVLVDNPLYPGLFAQAFGDPSITPARIAYAIATYERSLIADQTEWDRFERGNMEDSPEWLTGFAWFQRHQCDHCHTPPLFTNNGFANVGLRPAFQDRGRALISGKEVDDGDMKVPSLRNVALRKNFMHTGTVSTLDEVLDLYASPQAPADSLPNGEPYVVRLSEPARAAIKHFLVTALTDPRAAEETYPFDRPMLRGEFRQDDVEAPETPSNFLATTGPHGIELRWSAPQDDTGVVDYELRRNGAVLALLTQTDYTDRTAGPFGIHTYDVVARDSAGNRSAATTKTVIQGGVPLMSALLCLTTIILSIGLWRRRSLQSQAG